MYYILFFWPRYTHIMLSHCNITVEVYVRMSFFFNGFGAKMLFNLFFDWYVLLKIWIYLLYVLVLHEYRYMVKMLYPKHHGLFKSLSQHGTCSSTNFTWKRLNHLAKCGVNILDASEWINVTSCYTHGIVELSLLSYTSISSQFVTLLI